MKKQTDDKKTQPSDVEPKKKPLTEAEEALRQRMSSAIGLDDEGGEL